MTELEKCQQGLMYRWGTSGLIQINTDLPATTPCASFLAGDNGSSLSQSGEQSEIGRAHV